MLSDGQLNISRTRLPTSAAYDNAIVVLVVLIFAGLALLVLALLGKAVSDQLQRSGS